MSIDKTSDENKNDDTTPTDTDAYFESIACQEEIYLEVEEEDLRAILVFDDLTSVRDRKIRTT